MKTSLEQLYLPLEEAVSILHTRLSDKNPCSNDDLSIFLGSRPHAVIFRQLATPNYESALFVDLARAYNLQPLFIEFHEDRFLTRNPIKCALARMRFSPGPESMTSTTNVTRRVVDMPSADGRRFCDIFTVWHQPLSAFHHELLYAVPHFAGITTIDASRWFHSHGGHSHEYYAPFLGLFYNAILFEDFLLTPEEKPFTEDIVLPAFDAALSCLRVPPLITRISPKHNAEKAEWFHYPQALLSEVDIRLQTRYNRPA